MIPTSRRVPSRGRSTGTPTQDWSTETTGPSDPVLRPSDPWTEFFLPSRPTDSREDQRVGDLRVPAPCIGAETPAPCETDTPVTPLRPVLDLRTLSPVLLGYRQGPTRSLVLLPVSGVVGAPLRSPTHTDLYPYLPPAHRSSGVYGSDTVPDLPTTPLHPRRTWFPSGPVRLHSVPVPVPSTLATRQWNVPPGFRS